MRDLCATDAVTLALMLRNRQVSCREIIARMTDDGVMRRTRLGRQAAAKDASLLILQDALVQIRAMAHLRREVWAGENEPPLDYHERIRLIADACENLPGYLRANAPAQGLRDAWRKASDAQHEWLRETLAQHGMSITEFVAD